MRSAGIGLALVLVLAAAAAAPAGAATSILKRDDAVARFAAPAPAAPIAALLPGSLEPVLQARITGRGGALRGALNAERARVMLQSLTVPGWGQLSTGHPYAARVFGVIDAGIWTSFVAFQVQEHLRTDASIRTAREFAGIDLSDRSEEYRRIVGSYPSSELYNIYVVYRDAAALWYNDPVAYRDYIAQHQISGAGGWSWADPESYERYRAQRKDAQRAALRANTALALAIANRLVSAVHAAGTGGRAPARSGLRLEVTPDLSGPAMSVRFGLASRF